MGDITVDFKDNNILIDSKEFSINDFKYFVKNNNGFIIQEINNNNNIQKFIEAQQQLRALDMMKDGNVSGAENISGSVSGITGFTDVGPFNDLFKIEEIFFNSVKENIEKLEWTKISNSNTKKINIDFSFQESGLDSSYFINNPYLNYVNNFANEVLDTALRKSNVNSINFPEINNKIQFTNEFLNFFGFIDSNVQSKKINNTPKYEFIINIKNLQITEKTNNNPIDFFMGNKQKNNLIKNEQQNNLIKKYTNKYKKTVSTVKNALLVCKEMGDVLQVLFMLIWKNLNSGNTYCISTCDKVVALFCIMLNLNYTLSVVERYQQPKLKYIEYYNSGENENKTISEKNQIKFNKEKELIIKNNKELIKSIEILKNKNTPISFSVSGINGTKSFPKKFYENIFDDSVSIQNKLINFNLTDFTPSTIQKEIIDMKKNFTLIRLIVKNKNTYKLCFLKKYTLKNNLYNDFNSKFDNYGSTTFYNIGLKMESGGTGGATTDDKMEVDNENEETTNENKNEIRNEENTNENKNEIRNEEPRVNEMEVDEIRNEEPKVNEIINQETTNEDENYLKILEFCDEKAYFYYIDDETGQEFEYNNLYDMLKQDILAILFKFSLEKYFDDFYNILLYYFYFENEVFHGEKLESLIGIINLQIFDKKRIQEIINNIKKELEKSTRDIFENTNKTSQSVESNLQRFAPLQKNISKRSFEPNDLSLNNKKRSAESYDLSLNNKNQKVGGFKKNKTNKKKQIKKKNKETKKKNKKTKKTKKNIRIFYTSLAKKNKQTKKT